MNIKFLRQFSFFIAFISLVACSHEKKKTSKRTDIAYGAKDYIDSLVSEVQPNWFKGARRFNLTNSSGRDVKHFFFDVDPEVNEEEGTVNFVVTTPEGSSAVYNLDILSGQHYLGSNLCPQNDVWKSYIGKINRSNFTEGIIPRYLDQLSMPQKIIVFGDKRYYQKFGQENFFDAKIVGGFIELICPSGACDKRAEWYKRLVLVGVQKGATQYENTKNIYDLRTQVDWAYFRAYIENAKGQNYIGANKFAAYRMGALVGKNQAIRYFKKNSIYFSHKRMKQTRKTCYKLYDHIWNDLGKTTKNEIAAKTKKEVKKNALKNKQKQREKYFYKRFISSYRKYFKEYVTCSEYIYPTNINEGKQRHWFFAYYTAFHKLVDLGYYYDCHRKYWVRNLYREDGNLLVPVKRQLRNCSARDIDMAFTFAPKILGDLRAKGESSYRYISYDGKKNGTHKKIYSWVKTSNKKLHCSDETKAGKETLGSDFPKDISWKKRESEGQTKSKLGEVIY